MLRRERPLILVLNKFGTINQLRRNQNNDVNENEPMK
jgi:hypothetical protein